MSVFATRLPKYAFVTITFLLLAQLAIPAQAQNQITTCGTRVTAPGDYELANNLECTNDGIVITSGGVTLHLQNYSIECSPNRHCRYGIWLSAPTGNVKVYGPGTISGNFIDGVEIDNTPGGAAVTDIMCMVAVDGFFADAASNVYLVRNNVTHTSTGFKIMSNNSFLGLNHAEQNYNFGIWILGSQNLVLRNTTNGNSIGILTERGAVDNTIELNTALDNRIDLYEGNDTCRNVWKDNTFHTSNDDCIH